MPKKKNKYKKTLLIGVAVIGLIILGNKLSSYKIINIPEEIYTNTPKSSNHYDFINGQKKIIWYGADCPISQSRKKMIDKILDATSLGQSYKHQPQLASQFTVTKPIERFFIKNCGNNTCVTLPEQQQLIIIKDRTKLFKILAKFQDR
ncbi:MAG: hypothetical protein NC218_05675 [Acetobacter sp.]|nr:hypothetical protein [Acetobacter sp.]